MAENPIACVIGDMDMVRPLGLAAIPVVAAGPTGPETRWSRYTKGGIALPDLWADPPGTVEALISFAQTQPEKPVLFYQKDPAVLTISRYRTELSPHFHFVVPEPDLVEALVDKAQFNDLSLELGLPVPPSVILKGGDWSPEVESWPYPIIAKPAVRDHSEDSWFPIAGHAAKAWQADSPADLAALLDEPTLAGIPFIIQQMIQGPEDRIWSYHAFIDNEGATRSEFVGRKIRTWPARFGQSTAVEIVDGPSVRDLGREVLETLEFTGVAKVDFKEDADGQLHLLEINPRFSLWHHPGAASGVNIPATVYRYLLGRPVVRSFPRNGTRWCQVWGDRAAALDSGMGTLDWLRFAGKVETRRAAHLNDPGSMVGALAYGLSKRFNQGK